MGASEARSTMSSGDSVSVFRTHWSRGVGRQEDEKYEYLDHIVRDSADRMDWRLYGFSRSKRFDPLAADTCGDLTDHALRVGSQNRMTGEED